MSINAPIDPDALADALEQFAILVREGDFADRMFPDQAVRITLGMSSPQAVRDVAAEFGTVAREDADHIVVDVTLGVGSRPGSDMPDYSGALLLSVYAAAPRLAVIVDTDTGEVLTEPMTPANATVVANATTVVGRRVHVRAVTA